MSLKAAARTSVESLEERVLLAYTLDPSFGGDGIVEGNGGGLFVVQSDNKIISGVAGTNYVNALRRLNPDGSVDTSFGGTGQIETPFPMGDLVLAGGKIFVAGSSSTNRAFSVARYNLDGTPDLSFGGGDGIAQANLFGFVTNMAVAPDGKILLVGGGDGGDGTEEWPVKLAARFNADGSLDNSFDQDGMKETPVVGWINAHYAGAGFLSNGQMIVTDYELLSNHEGPSYGIERWNPDGSFNRDEGGFQTDWYGPPHGISDLEILPDDSYLIADGNRVYRFGGTGSFNNNGLLLDTFTGSNAQEQDDLIRGLYPSNGKILVTGNVDANAFVARLLPNGDVDPSFSGTTNGMVMIPDSTAFDVVADSNNRVIVGGLSNDRIVARLVDLPQSARSGVPFNVGQVIQAEDFDNGGEASAYHDGDPTNNGGAYRPTEAVDIEPTNDTGGGYDVGWAYPGEWTEYTFKITSGGNYTIDTRLASSKTGGQFHYEVDGIPKGIIDIPNTGSFTNWTTINSKLGFLVPGTHVLRLAIDPGANLGGQANFNWMKINPSTAAGEVGTGLTGYYYNNMDFTSLAVNRNDPKIDFNWGTGSPDPKIDPDTFSIRWTGKIQAPATGDYTFYTTTDDGARLTLDGSTLIDHFVPQPSTEWSSRSVYLAAGQKYNINLEYFERQYGALAKLSWSGPGISKQVIPTQYLYPTFIPPDTQPPTAVLNFDVWYTNDTEIKVMWNSASDNVAVDGYEVRLDNGNWLPVPDSDEVYLFSGLQPGTTHTASVRAIDTVGNRGPISTLTASTTNSNADSQPPSAVPNFHVVNTTDTSATLAWDAASDNVGVAGYEIFFENSTWVPIGADARSYTFTNLAPNSSHTVSLRAFDQAGNRGPANSVFFTTQPASTANGLKGEYFNNMDFTAPVMTRTDSNINFNWGTGSPAAGIDPDSFSVRWTGKITVPTTGRYTFYTTTDDGVRLWVNNQLLIDKLVPQAATEWSGSIDLVAGQAYDIRMDYFDRAGGAQAKLSWSGPGIAKQIVPASAFSGGGGSTTDTQPPTAVGNFRFTRIASDAIDLAWDLASDNVGVTGYELITNDSTPRVVLASDAHAYTASNLQPSTTYKFAITALDAAGNRGPTSTIFATTQASQSGGTGLMGSYFNNMDFTSPAFTRLDPTINFNWGANSPDPAKMSDPDTFSVRWTGFITVPTTGRYTFYTTTDDGARLTINGQRIIDKFVPQSATEWSGAIDLVAGQKYAFTMEYFDRAGGAQAKLQWAGSNISKQIVPQSVFSPT